MIQHPQAMNEKQMYAVTACVYFVHMSLSVPFYFIIYGKFPAKQS